MATLWNVLWIVVLALLAFLFFAAEVLDWLGRVEYVEQHCPKLWSAMNNRPMRVIGILIVFVLLAKDIEERLKEPELAVTIAAPPAPVVHFSSEGSQTKETSRTASYPTLQPVVIPNAASTSALQASAPHPSTQPPAAPYDELKSIGSQIDNLDGDWRREITSINQRLIEPYKFGSQRGQAWPTTLTPELVEQLASDDREVAARYQNIRPQIMKVHDDAIAKMSLSPNKKAADAVRFQSAMRAAGTPTPIADILSDKPNAQRFASLQEYIRDLLNQLGEYPL
jgi:hypothetical protein